MRGGGVGTAGGHGEGVTGEELGGNAEGARGEVKRRGKRAFAFCADVGPQAGKRRGAV